MFGSTMYPSRKVRNLEFSPVERFEYYLGRKKKIGQRVLLENNRFCRTREPVPGSLVSVGRTGKYARKSHADVKGNGAK